MSFSASVAFLTLSVILYPHVNAVFGGCRAKIPFAVTRVLCSHSLLLRSGGPRWPVLALQQRWLRIEGRHVSSAVQNCTAADLPPREGELEAAEHEVAVTRTPV